ncbi:MAG: peptidoglycan bridge formation glycyltransferase FemA/FemB family protein [Candidatus Obscuribacterales bacterium]|nr:peptidoglycan bridge formation glycyltransferase FemA/FemB family protein [Candidatus Obscuribacterales bacterium]
MGSLEVRLIETSTISASLADEWQALVSANVASGFMQSLPWAEFKRRQGFISLHLGIFKDDTLIGGSMLYTPEQNNGGGILAAPEGPVLPWDDLELARESLGLIIDFAKIQAKSLGVSVLRIEPRLPPPPAKILREFGRAPLDLVPNETLVIDIDRSPESILAAMRPKGRYNIGIAKRSLVETRIEPSNQFSSQSLSETVGQFYAVLCEAGKRDGFDVEPLKFFEQLASVLVPAGLAKFLFTEHEGDLLSAMLLITFGNRATYIYGGVSNKKRNLMGGYALQWAAIQAARANGCKSYDLYGFTTFCAPDHRYGRFSQFKSRFGGDAVKTIGAQDYFFLDHVTDTFIQIVKEISPLNQI